METFVIDGKEISSDKEFITFYRAKYGTDPKSELMSADRRLENGRIVHGVDSNIFVIPSYWEPGRPLNSSYGYPAGW